MIDTNYEGGRERIKLFLKKIPILRTSWHQYVFFSKWFRKTLRNIVRYPFRYKHSYTYEYYTNKNSAECKSWYMKIIRPSDMGAAIMYAFGITNYDKIKDMFAIQDDPMIWSDDITLDDQLEIISKNITRKPEFVLDMGCGKGEITATFTHLGIKAIGIDPSLHLKELVVDTMEKYYGSRQIAFINKTALAAIKQLDTTPDTVIFCESIEHIPKREFEQILEIIQNMSKIKSIRVIITNWINYHPIIRQNFDWDHLRNVDDDLYDRIESKAKTTIFRRGSHLVVDF